jgi:hypothetical protein
MYKIYVNLECPWTYGEIQGIDPSNYIILSETIVVYDCVKLGNYKTKNGVKIEICNYLRVQATLDKNSMIKNLPLCENYINENYPLIVGRHQDNFNVIDVVFGHDKVKKDIHH